MSTVTYLGDTSVSALVERLHLVEGGSAVGTEDDAAAQLGLDGRDVTGAVVLDLAHHLNETVRQKNNKNKRQSMCNTMGKETEAKN